MEIHHAGTTSTDINHWTDHFCTEYHGKWFDLYKTVDREQPEQSNLQIIESGCNEDIGHYMRETYSSNGRLLTTPTEAETADVLRAFIEQWN